MRTPAYDPGLTQQFTTPLRRAINQDGTFNVHQRGRTWRDIHPYLFMINAPWPVFAAMIFGGFVIANAAFALIYVKIGVGHLQGADTSTALSRFLSAFFFSAQTFTTVGYGRISPDGVLTSMVASLQALLGLMALAIGTGLLFGRFSRPAARLAFSKQMVMSPYQSGTSLQLRVANRRSNNLMEVEARVMLSTVVTSDQGTHREFQYLPLERRVIQFLPLSWTIVHPIDESSPLWARKPEDLAAEQAEFLVLIKAFDDTFFQTVHVRYSYRHDEVVWGARFVPAFEPDAQGEMVLDLRKLSEIAPAESPGNPKKVHHPGALLGGMDDQ